IQIRPVAVSIFPVQVLTSSFLQNRPQLAAQLQIQLHKTAARSRLLHFQTALRAGKCFFLPAAQLMYLRQQAMVAMWKLLPEQLQERQSALAPSKLMAAMVSRLLTRQLDPATDLMAEILICQMARRKLMVV